MQTLRRDQLIVMLYGLAGGFADTTSLLLYKTFTGHVTGNLVFMMVALAHREWQGVAQRLLAIAVFLAGTRAGFAVAKARHSARWLLPAQAALLLPLIFSGTLAHISSLSVALFCAALGLQNGVITTVHKVSIHSTFVSGDFTKLLKVASANSADKQSPAIAAPLTLLPLLIAGFVAGALAAAVVQLGHHPHAAFPLLLGIFAFACAATFLPTVEQQEQPRN